MGVSVKGNRIVIAVHGALGYGCLCELVTADIVNQVIDGRQGICVNHLRNLGRKGGAHIRYIAGCKPGGPLGIKVIP